jgi:hypothetical protein
MEEENVIITLTTIPTRLNSPYGYDMRHTLESLLNQKYNNFEINFAEVGCWIQLDLRIGFFETY